MAAGKERKGSGREHNYSQRSVIDEFSVCLCSCGSRVWDYSFITCADYVQQCHTLGLGIQEDTILSEL